MIPKDTYELKSIMIAMEEAERKIQEGLRAHKRLEQHRDATAPISSFNSALIGSKMLAALYDVTMVKEFISQALKDLKCDTNENTIAP